MSWRSIVFQSLNAAALLIILPALPFGFAGYSICRFSDWLMVKTNTKMSHGKYWPKPAKENHE